MRGIATRSPGAVTAGRGGLRLVPPGPVLVCHPSAELYGSDRVLLDSVEALLAAHDRVEVRLPGPGPLVAELEARGAVVSFGPMAVLRKAALRPRGLLALLATALRTAPAQWRLLGGFPSVYVNTVTIPTWLLLGRLRGRTVACHVHEAERSAPRPVRWALTAPLLLADRLVVNSRFSLGWLLASHRRLATRSHVVLNPVPGPAEPVPPRPAPLPDLRILYVGRLSARKGVDVAVRAVGLLGERGHRVQLRLVGGVFEGYEEQERALHRLVADLGLTDRVDLTGFVPDVTPHYAWADVALVPSRLDEPFGNTAVEAVLARVPLVVTDTSGLREAAAGYRSVERVAPDDPAALADGVERLVGRWPELAADTSLDLADARERHSPAAYHRSLRAALDLDIRPEEQPWPATRS